MGGFAHKALVVGLLGGVALAQESASYRLNEHALNAGGRPAAGVVLQSSSYTISLDAIGDAVVASSLASASYQISAGLAQAYPPPGEVLGLSFVDKETMVWDAERSAGVYNLYRDLTSELSDLGFGLCEQPALPEATATDADPVPSGGCFFYLVSARNLLGEEGTKGFQSDGTERQGTFCP